MEKAKWKIEKIPDYLLELVNAQLSDSETDKLLLKTAASKVISRDGQPFLELTEQLTEKVEKIEAVNRNPLKYATIVKYPNGTDLYLSKKTFLKIMRKLPLDLEIDNKIPEESPIAAHLFGQEIKICPFELYGRITKISPKIENEGLIFRGIDSYNEEEDSLHLNRLSSVKLYFYPTKYGIKYKHINYGFDTVTEKVSRTNKISNKDEGLKLEIFLERITLEFH